MSCSPTAPERNKWHTCQGLDKVAAYCTEAVGGTVEMIADRRTVRLRGEVERRRRGMMKKGRDKTRGTR